MLTYSMGTTPSDVILDRLPVWYGMTLNRSDLATLAAADRAGARMLADRGALGPGEMLRLLDRLWIAGLDGDDNALGLRSSILSTLDIEEV